MHKQESILSNASIVVNNPCLCSLIYLSILYISFLCLSILIYKKNRLDIIQPIHIYNISRYLYNNCSLFSVRDISRILSISSKASIDDNIPSLCSCMYCSIHSCTFSSTDAIKQTNSFMIRNLFNPGQHQSLYFFSWLRKIH